jgi:hypothetical protein
MRADIGYAGDDHDSDQSGNQTVLDSRRAGLIANKL